MCLVPGRCIFGDRSALHSVISSWGEIGFERRYKRIRNRSIACSDGLASSILVEEFCCRRNLGSGLGNGGRSVVSAIGPYVASDTKCKAEYYGGAILYISRSLVHIGSCCRYGVVGLVVSLQLL